MVSGLYTDLTVVHEPKLHDLYEYWDAKRRGRAMPSRADLDPVEIPDLLANLILVDVSGSPPQFRIRLAGTDIVTRYGAELTGKRLDDIDLGSDLAQIKEQYEETALKVVPTYCRHFIETRKRKLLRYERLLMPLSGDGSTVNMLLGGIYPLPPELAAEGAMVAAPDHQESRGSGQGVVLLRAKAG
ncbi:MAG TPA: PAS domain-containing protein [Candidatus Acidoferrum sp.]|nr:PAS domain-containing protein [Candidatus Acidoferrum sp.]